MWFGTFLDRFAPSRGASNRQAKDCYCYATFWTDNRIYHLSTSNEEVCYQPKPEDLPSVRCSDNRFKAVHERLDWTWANRDIAWSINPRGIPDSFFYTLRLSYLSTQHFAPLDHTYSTSSSTLGNAKLLIIFFIFNPFYSSFFELPSLIRTVWSCMRLHACRSNQSRRKYSGTSATYIENEYLLAVPGLAFPGFRIVWKTIKKQREETRKGQENLRA